MRCCARFSGLALVLAVAQTACTSPAEVQTGPTNTAGTDTLELRTLESAGARRTYRVHIPSTVSGEVPLVIVLHGGGGNGSTLIYSAGWLDKAEAEGFIVAFPDGTGRREDRYTWNAGGCCAYAMTSKAGDVAFIGDLIDHLSGELNVDPARIYLAGISNGGMLTHRVGAVHGDKLAAIGVVVGAMFEDQPVPTTKLPVLAINAIHDGVVPYEGGSSPMALVARAQSALFLSAAESANRWASWNGCDPSPEEVSSGSLTTLSYTGCKEGADVVFFSLADGGHGWPGGTKLRESPEQASTAINATDELWAFFATHPSATAP